MDYVYQAPLAYERTVGVVLGSFSPMHRGHLDLIYRAKKECGGGALVVVTGYDNDKGWPRMTLRQRYAMAREFFRDDDLVAVYALSDDELGITQYNDVPGQWDWKTWLDGLYGKVAALNCGGRWSRRFLEDNTVFYVGEPEYASQLGAMGHRVVLVDRGTWPLDAEEGRTEYGGLVRVVSDGMLDGVSATAIRKDPYGHWDDMAWTFRRKFSHNVLVLGTASEGKTTLVEDVGRYFNLPYSYEWARDYVRKHVLGDWELDAADFAAFLAGQYEHNRDLIESRMNPGVFISDSDCMTTRMFAEYYADDPAMALTREEFDRIVAPLADMYAGKTRWDKIFVVRPHEGFTDDHERYMPHGDLKIRQAMWKLMERNLVDSGRMPLVEYLDGNYLENYARVRAYVKDVLGGKRPWETK